MPLCRAPLPTFTSRRMEPLPFARTKTKEGPADAKGTSGASVLAGGVSWAAHLSAHCSFSESFFCVQWEKGPHFMPQIFCLMVLEKVHTQDFRERMFSNRAWDRERSLCPYSQSPFSQHF